MPKKKVEELVCTFCKNPIAKEVTVCPNCGYNTQTHTVTQAVDAGAKAAGQKKKIPPLKLIIPVICLCLLGAGVYYYFNNKQAVEDSIASLSEKAAEFAPGQKGKKKKKPAGFSSNTTPVKIDKAVFRIEGILFDPAGKSSIVSGGEVYWVGDSFENIKVTGIDENSVELSIDGHSRILRVGESVPLPTR